jgi:hypothetical protein
VEIEGTQLLIASLADIIRSKKAARRLRDLAVMEILERALEETPRTTHKAGRSRAESERALRDMIRRWQALPPSRRTNFLRKRIGPGRSVL